MIIMSVDLGDARTGIAVCDKGESFAFPKGVIKEYNKDKLLDKLCEKAKELDAELLVVGYPKNMDNSLGERASKSIEFKRMLEEKITIPVVLVDERLSTKEATNILIEADTSRKKRKKVIDKMAANIILQSYLDRRKNGR